MSNFLNNVNNFNLVIFTNKESFSLVDEIVDKNNKNIKIIVKEYEEFETWKERENWITYYDSDIIKVDLNLLSTINNKILNKEEYDILDKLYKTIYPWNIKYNILNNIRFNISIFYIKKIIKQINEDVFKY
jgi:hypothetical protein